MNKYQGIGKRAAQYRVIFGTNGRLSISAMNLCICERKYITMNVVVSTQATLLDYLCRTTDNELEVHLYGLNNAFLASSPAFLALATDGRLVAPPTMFSFVEIEVERTALLVRVDARFVAAAFSS